MSRSWLMLLGLCQSHAAGIAAESTQVSRGLEDDASNDASLSYRNTKGESESEPDNQCPKVVQRALPFPLPNPALVSDTFDHYLHCKQVVLNTADPTSQDKAGAVITIEEHFKHCEAIVDSIALAPLLLMDSLVCDALGLTGNSASTGCYSNMWMTDADMSLDWNTAIDAIYQDMSGMRDELIEAQPDRTMCVMQYMVEVSYFADNMMLAPVPIVEETPQANRLHGHAEMTSLPEGCKLSPEYYGMAMGWNHENLVVKSFRQPDGLTEAEQAYLGAWVNDPSVLAQYQIAEACSGDIL